MDELQALQATPRDESLVRRMGSRFEPAWGFLAYGLLYLFVPVAAGLFVPMGAGLALGAVVGLPLPPWLLLALGALALVVFGLAWWPFALWIRRRRARVYRLFRDGRFVEGTIVEVGTIRVRAGTPVTRATAHFQDEGRPGETTLSLPGQPASIVIGAKVPLLVLPGSKYSAAFVDGRAVAAA